MNESAKLEKLDKEIVEKQIKLKEDTLHYLIFKKESIKKESNIINRISDIRAILSIQNDQLNNVNINIIELNDKIKITEDEIIELNKLEDKQLENEKVIYKKEIERIDSKRKDLEFLRNLEINNTNEELNKITNKIDDIQKNLNTMNNTLKDKLKGDIKNRRNIINKNFVFLETRKNINNVSSKINESIIQLNKEINFHTKEYKKNIAIINKKIIESHAYYTTLINDKLNFLHNLEEDNEDICNEINKLNEEYDSNINKLEDSLNTDKNYYKLLLTNLSQRKTNEEMKLKKLDEKEQKQLINIYLNHKINSDNIRHEKGIIHEMINELQQLNKQQFQLKLTLNQFKMDIENKFAKLNVEFNNANDRIHRITTRLKHSEPLTSQSIYQNKLATLQNTKQTIQKNICENINTLDELEQQLKTLKEKLWNGKKDLKTLDLIIHDKLNQHKVIQKRINKLKSEKI